MTGYLIIAGLCFLALFIGMLAAIIQLNSEVNELKRERSDARKQIAVLKVALRHSAALKRNQGES